MATTFLTRKNGQFSGKGDNIANLIAGQHVPNSPYQWVPESELAQLLTWNVYSSTSSFNQSATEGASDWKVVLENSGTAAMTGTAVGFEGALLSTSGAADNNANHAQLCRAFLPAAGKVAVCITRVLLPATPAANIGEIRFGFWNTAADPVDTAPTHGAYFAIDDGSANCLVRSKDGTTSSDGASQFTSAVSLAYDLGVVIDGTSAVIFYSKLSTATSWNVLRKTTNLPTLAQRMSWCHQNGSGAARALTFDRFFFAGQK